MSYTGPGTSIVCEFISTCSIRPKADMLTEKVESNGHCLSLLYYSLDQSVGCKHQPDYSLGGQIKGTQPF